MTMSSSRIPPKSQQDIEDFLIFVAQAKDNPRTDSQLWENLSGLVKKLLATEDKPTKLAEVIKQWCQDCKITLNPQELAEYRAILRANMLKKGQPIPQANPGEKPAVVYNQALIVETVKEAINKHHE
jgi:hypothetical protein